MGGRAVQRSQKLKIESPPPTRSEEARWAGRAVQRSQKLKVESPPPTRSEAGASGGRATSDTFGPCVMRD